MIDIDSNIRYKNDNIIFTWRNVYKCPVTSRNIKLLKRWNLSNSETYITACYLEGYWSRALLQLTYFYHARVIINSQKVITFNAICIFGNLKDLSELIGEIYLIGKFILNRRRNHTWKNEILWTICRNIYLNHSFTLKNILDYYIDQYLIRLFIKYLFLLAIFLSFII